MSKNTSTTPAVIDPVLNEIVNCQLTKKDIMELIESEIENEVDKELNEINSILSYLEENAKKLSYSLADALNKEKNRIYKDILQQNIKWAKMARSITPEVKPIAHVDFCFRTKDNTYPTSARVAQYRYYTDVEIYYATARYEIYAKSSDAMIEDFKYSKSYSAISVSDNYIKLDKELTRQFEELKVEYKRAYDIYDTLIARKANLKSELKTISAGITRTALQGNSKGTAILNMLAKIRNNAKKQLEQK